MAPRKTEEELKQEIVSLGNKIQQYLEEGNAARITGKALRAMKASENVYKLSDKRDALKKQLKKLQNI